MFGVSMKACEEIENILQCLQVNRRMASVVGSCCSVDNSFIDIVKKISMPANSCIIFREIEAFLIRLLVWLSPISSGHLANKCWKPFIEQSRVNVFPLSPSSSVPFSLVQLHLLQMPSDDSYSSSVARTAEKVKSAINSKKDWNVGENFVRVQLFRRLFAADFARLSRKKLMDMSHFSKTKPVVPKFCQRRRVWCAN